MLIKLFLNHNYFFYKIYIYIILTKKCPFINELYNTYSLPIVEY